MEIYKQSKITNKNKTSLRKIRRQLRVNSKQVWIVKGGRKKEKKMDSKLKIRKDQVRRWGKKPKTLWIRQNTSKL